MARRRRSRRARAHGAPCRLRRVSSVDQTLDEVSYADAGAGPRSPLLFLVLEADRPLKRGVRWSLVGVQTLSIGRGDERVGIRSSDGTTLDVRVPGKWMSSQHAVVRAVANDWIV